MFAFANSFDNPKYIADVAGNIAANAAVEEVIAHGAFPNPVEIEADEFAFSVEDRTSGIAACGMVGSNKGNRNGARSRGILLFEFRR